MKRLFSWLILATACGALLAYLPMRDLLSTAQGEAREFKFLAEKNEKELIGHTRYLSFITTGKQSVSEQMRLLTATIVREEGITQVIERVFLPGLSSSGTVAIWYTAEYAFGFDLQPEHYDIRAVASGIEVVVNKPALVTTPAISKLRYKVLAGGFFTDEKDAVIQLYEEAAARAKTQGQAMANEAPIQALCEKKLVGFLHDLLAKQPGVTVVPYISVKYR